MSNSIQVYANEPGCLVQALWFLFVGWWLGAAAISVAWFLNATIIGLPLGMAILNNVPKILALQDSRKRYEVHQVGDLTQVAAEDVEQRPFIIRALFFLLIGWWWSGIWLAIAYALSSTVILMPIGLPMFRMTPAMTTLQRY